MKKDTGLGVGCRKRHFACVVCTVEKLRSGRELRESAERILILTSDAAIERMVIEFGLEEKHGCGVDEDGDGNKSTAATLTGRQMRSQIAMRGRGQRRCDQKEGRGNEQKGDANKSADGAFRRTQMPVNVTPNVSCSQGVWRRQSVKHRGQFPGMGVNVGPRP
jgi:hypothetical protein